MGGEDRGAAMAASVVRTARTFGVPAEAISLLSEAHALAMEPRVASLDDDHHPLYLHPGRSVLILLRDVRLLDPLLLAATFVTESEDEAFRIPVDMVRAVLGEAVTDVVDAVPRAGSDGLAEALVTAPEGVRLVALAERLDHLRHAHLRGAGRGWKVRVHAEAEAVWLPVAERTHARLAQRYRHWCGAFARRLEREDF